MSRDVCAWIGAVVFALVVMGGAAYCCVLVSGFGDRAAIVTAAGTLLLADFAALAAWYGFRAVGAARDQTLNEVMPIVRPTGPWWRNAGNTTIWFLKVENIGRGPAINVECQVKYEDPNDGTKETKIETKGAMAVGDSPMFSWGLSGLDKPGWHQATITYRDVYQRMWKAIAVYDGSRDTFKITRPK